MLRKSFVDSIAAGVCLGLGGAIYLACENKLVGAFLFAVALMTICYFGLYLYTGKIGFLLDSHKKNDVICLILGVAGNAVGTLAMGLMGSIALTKLADSAKVICEAKLTQGFAETFIKGIFCGILMYIAVRIFRDGKNIAGIIFCIPTFILSGYEHSIADMYYFFLAGIFSLDMLLFILIVVAGNTVGGLLLPALALLAGNKKAQ